LGLTRSSSTKANVLYSNVNGYLVPAKVQALVRKATAHGANPKDLVMLINPLTYDRYCESIEGYAPRTTKLKLPGGNFEVPIIGHGITQLPVIDDVRIQRDKVIVLDRSKLFRLNAPGGWNKRAGKFWKDVPTGSTTIGSDYMALFDIWYQMACVLPDTSVVGYGISTA